MSILQWMKRRKRIGRCRELLDALEDADTDSKRRILGELTGFFAEEVVDILTRDSDDVCRTYARRGLYPSYQYKVQQALLCVRNNEHLPLLLSAYKEGNEEQRHSLASLILHFDFVTLSELADDRTLASLAIKAHIYGGFDATTGCFKKGNVRLPTDYERLLALFPKVATDDDIEGVAGQLHVKYSQDLLILIGSRCADVVRGRKGWNQGNILHEDWEKGIRRVLDGIGLPDHSEPDEPLASYSLVKDQDGGICGIWLRDPAQAQDRNLLLMLLIKHGARDNLGASVLAGDLRVVSNTYDDQGGCFVMFGSAPAPGEA
ncbi:MAG: hypothetical protein GTN82_02720 [Candidatus Aminicenantes bacterium]|nr:hypothetical protein [Candidatus Aminicenantes bacterium]